MNELIEANDAIKQWKKFIKAIKAHDIEKVKSLIEAGVDINTKNSELALHAAERTGNIKIVRLLIEAGADVNIKDIEGKTPLDHAMDCYKSHKAFYKSKLFSKAIAELKEIVELLKGK